MKFFDCFTFVQMSKADRLRQQLEEIATSHRRLTMILNFRMTHALPRDAEYASAVVDREALAILAHVDHDTDWWRTLHRVIDRSASIEQSAVLQPALSSEARHFNAGRLAALKDLQEMLLTKWAEARDLQRE